MRPLRAAAVCLLALGAGTGCLDGEPVRSFALIETAEARARLARERLTLVEVTGGGSQNPAPGAVLWTLPEAPNAAIPPDLPSASGVLVIAAAETIGFRAAAALSRAGVNPVLLCIPRNAEERSGLYALALETKEIPRERDS